MWPSSGGAFQGQVQVALGLRRGSVPGGAVAKKNRCNINLIVQCKSMTHVPSPSQN